MTQINLTQINTAMAWVGARWGGNIAGAVSVCQASFVVSKNDIARRWRFGDRIDSSSSQSASKKALMEAKDWKFPMACPECQARSGFPFYVTTEGPLTADIRCCSCQHAWNISAARPATIVRRREDRRQQEQDRRRTTRTRPTRRRKSSDNEASDGRRPAQGIGREP